MQRRNSINDSPFWKAMQRFAAASVGASVAELSTLPVDIGKVRLQLQKPLPDGTLKYRNMFQAGARVASEEGATALWKGATPALTRQVSYTGLSLVLYEPIRDLIAGGTPLEDLNFMWRLMAGGCAGGASIACVNPTDVVKTQMQNHTGNPKMMSIIKNIMAKEGVRGFWSGVQPNVARCFIGNACELGFYDQAKTWIVNSPSIPVQEGPLAHFGASTFAGFISAVCSCPVDVVRTRLFNQAGKEQVYKGTIDALINIPKKEGFGALYGGFFPLFVRKVTWTVLFFLSYEQAKTQIGYIDAK
tara:strand:- start:100 stop:1005 length:906 start_codon:yes stop_codon:yes gene_type:complete